MEDLRLNSSEGEHLVLESQDGKKFRLLVDDSIRTAIRTAGVQLSNTDLTLTPREVQSAVRGGQSVEEIITAYRAPRDYVEKFAQPVLDELTHVLSSALGVRISVAGDRYNDVSQTEFGEIIASRLHASGVTNFNWKTYRDENHTWLVLVSYLLDGVNHNATWSFDIKKLLLAPENENAVALSTQNQLTSAPKLKPVEAEPAASAVADTAALPDTQRLESVIPIGRASDRAVVEKPANENIAESNDLLDALKKKREERASEAASTRTVEVSTEVVSEIEAEVPAEEPTPTPAPVRRSGRPSIPSFDEIVQGTKSEEE